VMPEKHSMVARNTLILFSYGEYENWSLIICHYGVEHRKTEQTSSIISVLQMNSLWRSCWIGVLLICSIWIQSFLDKHTQT
jgi:hypothetical protein